MNRTAAIAIAILAIAVGAGWLFMSRSVDEVPPAVVQAPPPAPARPPEVEAVALPDIAESDGMTRDLAAGFGMLGALAETLLGEEELLQRFVRVTDAVASGSSPAADLGLLAPEEPFRVTEDGEQFYVDPASFDRYDTVAEAIARIDADAAAAAYRQIEPLADQVYSEIMGQPSAFRPVLLRALSVLNTVPIANSPAELVDAINRYRYADEALESLTLPQKHLLRMGPANVGRIQARLRQLARLLS